MSNPGLMIKYHYQHVAKLPYMYGLRGTIKNGCVMRVFSFIVAPLSPYRSNNEYVTG